MNLKKLISLGLAILLMFTVIFASSIVANGLDEISISSTDVTVDGEKNIRVPIYINNNTGLMGFGLSFNYDDSLLTPVSVEYGEAIQGGLNDNIEGDAVPGEFKVIYGGVKEEKFNGLMFYINFEVNQSIYGTTKIDIEYSSDDTFNGKYEDVVLKCEDFYITRNYPTPVTTPVVPSSSKTESSSTTTTTYPTSQSTQPTQSTPSSTQPSESKSVPTQPTTKPIQSSVQPTTKPSKQPIVKPTEKPSASVVLPTTNPEPTQSTAPTVKPLELKAPKFTVKKAGKKIKVNYKKVNGATGFQVRYRIKGKWKMKTFEAKKSVTRTIKVSKKGSYKVQLRAIAKVNGKTIRSNWSSSKKVKI